MVIKLGSPLGKLWPQEALKRSLAWFEAAAYEYLQKQRRSSNVPTAQIDPRRQTIVCVSLRITNQAKIIRSTTHPLTIRRITEKGASYTHQKQRYIYIHMVYTCAKFDNPPSQPITCDPRSHMGGLEYNPI